jgi:BirA family biotin operon repressor/biotin-[acetyl-CoA-carboxylase] ligase
MRNIFHPLIYLKTIDSTNNYAAQLLIKHQVEEETIILTDEQTSGKGQGDNSWESEPGKNATFSLILFPLFLSPEKQFLLNKSITLGVLDFLCSLSLGQKLFIKWPNDIYAGNRKMGGILIQNTVCGREFESSIAGIGLNLNQVNFNPVLPNPVSLMQITGKSYNVEEVVNHIVEAIDKRFLQLRNGSFDTLNTDYQKNLFGINEWKDYVVNNKVIKGKIRGVDDNGFLKVEMINGSEFSFQHGDINLIFI